MSFLSSEQRQAALRQIAKADALLADDLTTLSERIANVSELRRCLKYNANRIILADEGDCSIIEIEEADEYARNMMAMGISHYPVVVTSGEKRVVKA